MYKTYHLEVGLKAKRYLEQIIENRFKSTF